MPSIFWIWMAAAVILLILELITPTLIFACLVAAAFVSGTYSFFSPDAYYVQIGIFVAVSIVLLPLTRTLARKITHDAPQKSNVDAIIGKTVLVTKAIDPDRGGQVQVEGEVWLANAGERIEVDTRVEILSVSGTKVHVKKI